MERRKKELNIKPVRRLKVDGVKGVDTKKICGVIKLKDDPLQIQKK